MKYVANSLHQDQNCKRDRSDSIDRAYGASPSLAHIVWETEAFLPGSRERSDYLEQMHSVLIERRKEMRTGPGPGSLKQDDASMLESFYTGNDASGALDEAGGGSLAFIDHGLEYNLHDPDHHLGGFGGGRKSAGGGVSDGPFFAMDDMGATDQLSSSFKESVSFGKREDDDEEEAHVHHHGPSSILPDFSPAKDTL
eukprot:CAMPEP_0113688358 /NCGR_PEP_ID=MMETSP0038_2-20120614/16483_1 /TAXON_ID=2898 /ORGANISM="Cryptomonas paramecium" /LENGTH=196 /DNA_ID=CAMNT_0000609147 /DNA_START=226 /DNA_END=812 /DNA_ORIENTATION=+ /assembly_acc=CAM_ASM_000170